MTFSKEVVECVIAFLIMKNIPDQIKDNRRIIRIRRFGMNNNRMYNMGLPVDRKSSVTYYQIIMRAYMKDGIITLEIFSVKKHKGKEGYGTDDNPEHYSTFSPDNRPEEPPRRMSESAPTGHIHQPPPPTATPPLYDAMTGTANTQV